MKYIKTAVTVVLLGIVSVVKIFFDILQYDLSFADFSSAYWITLIRDNVLLLIVLYLSASLQKDKVKALNQIYLDLRGALVNAFIQLKNANSIERFKAFIETDNRQAKLETYKLKLNQKITALEDSIKRRENKINVKRVAKGLAPLEEPKTEKLIALRLKVKEKKEQLADAEKLIDYVRVRYQKVSYSVLFGEEENKVRDERDLQYHELLHNFFILGKKAVLVFAIGLFSIVQFQGAFLDWSLATVLKIAYGLFSISLSVYLGVSDGDKFVKGQVCDTLRRRLNFVQGFIERNIPTN